MQELLLTNTMQELLLTNTMQKLLLKFGGLLSGGLLSKNNAGIAT